MRKTIPLAVLTALIYLTSVSCAVNIGLGPTQLEYKDLLKGGYGEKYFTISTSGNENLSCAIEVKGDMKDWISFDVDRRFTLAARSAKRIKVMVEPPIDVQSGTYTSEVRVVASPSGGIEGEGAGLSVGAGVRVTIIATVTGDQRISYKIEGVSVQDTEIGYPIKFSTVILNNGNVRVKPTITFEIMDKNTGTTKKTFTYSNVEILPTKTESINIEIPSTGLEVGKYDAKMTSGEMEQMLTFNILEKGTLALTGVLQELVTNKIWVEAGETAKIRGDFKNEGELYIEKAKLVAEAYLIDENYHTEKLMKTMESDVFDVPVGAQVDLNTYFTPEQAGRYVIRGYIVYSGKKTAPKETIVNVIAKPPNYIPYYLAIGVLVILIIYYLSRKSEDGRTRRFKKIWGDYLKVK